MPRQTPIRLRPYANAQKPHLKFRLPIPRGLRGVAGAATKFFTTKRQGDGYAKWLATQQKKYGEAGAAFPEALRADALRAADVLLPFKISLLDAARIAAEILKRKGASVTTALLVEKYLAALAADGAVYDHVRTARSKLKKFTDAFPLKLVSEFTAADLDDWLRSLPLAPTTRNGVRMYVRAAFEYGRKSGFVPVNVVADTATAKVSGKPVSVLSPDQMVKLLTVCDPRLQLLFALGGFAGLRPCEVEKLRWEHVDLGRRTVSVDPHDPRSYANRFVDLSENLCAWLDRTPSGSREGLVVALSPASVRALRQAAVKAAGIKWIPDVLRHSFASYFYAAHEDIGKLTAAMGHGSTKMVAAFYRARVTGEAAKEWWAIKPAL